MANVKISDLSAYSSPASTDVVPIVDLVNDATKKVTVADLLENAGSGSASAPSFAFDADSNLGMYRADADKLGFTTGGTGRVFIDSSGNVFIGGATSAAADIALNADGSATFGGIVGVGTSSPNNMLHLNGASPAIRLSDTGANGSAFSIIEDNNGFLKLRNDAGNSGTGSGIAFDVDASERMRIDSSGRVGIGTSVPGVRCEIKGSTVVEPNSINNFLTYGAFRIQPSSSADTKSFAIAGGPSGLVSIQNVNDSSTAGPLAINPFGGNVGIGDSSPDRKLQVINSTDALMRLGRSDASSHGSTDVEIKFSKNYYSNAVFEAASHRFEIQGTEKMRIDSSGNVYIGGTTASSADIALNADGSASFGSLNTASSITRGVTVSNLGTITTQSSGSENRVLFQGYKGSSLNSTINSDGSITAAGVVESTSGGFKFPDGTTQTTASGGSSLPSVGTAPNEIPINQYLGQQAFVDEVGTVRPSASEPQANKDINFQYVSDTSIKIRMRGADGTVRSTTLTLS